MRKILHCIQQFSYIVAVSSIAGEIGIPVENHRPVASR